MIRPRIFVMHSHLLKADGHPYTESLGWRRLARERDFTVDLFANRWADPQVLADTGARPLFGSTYEDLGRFMRRDEAMAPPDPEMAALQTFILTSFEIARGCREAWNSAEDKPQAVIFPWASAGVLNGASDWLADLSPEARPKLVFNIVRPEPSWTIDAGRRQVSGDFSWFRFACRRLRSLSAPGDMIFTAVEPRLCRAICSLGEVDCQPAPLHKFYPSEPELEALRPAERPPGVGIGVFGPSHTWEKGWTSLPEIMGRVCARRPDVTFFAQAETPEHGKVLAEALHAAGRPARVTIQPGALPTDDYFRKILASDLVLQPYDHRVYALMPSGIFADAVVCGAPVVAPAGTWISDRLDEGWGAGETFATPSCEAIVDSTLRALGRLDALHAKAARQGDAWRRVHSLEAYADHVLARLRLAPEQNANRPSQLDRPLS